MRLTVGLCPALTEHVMSKLKEAGVTNIISFMQKDVESLALETSISYKDLQSIRNIIHAHYAAFPVSGSDMLSEAVRSAVIISTGIASLDKLLGGGLMAGEIVELCGGWGVGKTSLCVQLALHSALKLGLHVLYIDPTATVSTNRLEPFLDKATELQTSVMPLSLIKVITPEDIWGLFQALNIVHLPYTALSGQSNSDNNKNGDKIKLVIVDSLPLLLTPVQTGSLKQGNGMVCQVASSLKQIASELKVAVVVVNNVVSGNFGSTDTAKQNSHKRWKPALGRFWTHVPNTRLFMEKVDNKEQSAKRPHSSTSGTSSAEPASALQVNITIWKSSRLKSASSFVSVISP